MANRITYCARPDLAHIIISNGSTGMAMQVLALAASALSVSDKERELAAWIASNDQNIFGRGMVGFDMSEIPWSANTLEADRAFLLRVVAAAESKLGWEQLDYIPSELHLQPILEQLRKLIASFDPGDASKDDGKDWNYGGKPKAWTLCPVHRIYKHSHGCILCHDQELGVVCT